MDKLPGSPVPVSDPVVSLTALQKLKGNPNKPIVPNSAATSLSTDFKAIRKTTANSKNRNPPISEQRRLTKVNAAASLVCPKQVKIVLDKLPANYGKLK